MCRWKTSGTDFHLRKSARNTGVVMPTDELENNCTYEISRFGSTVPCTCSPESDGKTCQCHGLSNPFLREAAIPVPDHGPVLVAYVRVAEDLASEEEQTTLISEYCL